MSNQITPMPHQKEAINRLVESRGFLLADDMGLGKTFSALLAAKQLGVSTTIICPAFLTSTWAKSAQAVDISVDIFSYEKARKDINQVPQLLIIDESHYIKNGNSQRGKFCVDLSKLVRAKGGSVWLLSGTPITKDVDDLYSQFDAIGALPLNKANKPWSLWGFKEALMSKKPDRYTRSGIKHEGLSAEGAKLLRQIRKGKYFRRTKDAVLDLPAKLYTKIYIAESAKTLSKELAKYEDLDLQALQASEHFMSLRKDLAMLKAVKVIKALQEELKEAPKQIVIFSAHARAIKEFEAHQKALNAEIITGATPPEKRRWIVERFQKGEIQVLAATIGAAGIGITLTAASDVRFIDRSFSPAENTQAEDRCYRIGQAERVVITDYLTSDPIEERLLKLVAQKQLTISATE